MKVQMLKQKETYTVDYPQALDFTKSQESIFWTADEIEMEKDIHDLKTKLTEAELHGVITVLKLFTLYELHVGNEYWLDYVRKTFPRPEIQRMASLFGMFELNVHAPFYDKLNEVMGLKTDEFYESYVHDKELKKRMDWIDKQFSTKDPLLITALGSITEGAILYSNFAFLKHFQAEGKNKLMDMPAGINFSVRDENLHSMAGAWLHKELKKEMKLDKLDYKKYERKIQDTCNVVCEHEFAIIEKIFEKGAIKGITDTQMKNFIQSRLNVCLEQLDIEKMYDVDYDPISQWFYKNINSGSLHDFFAKQGNNYTRDWTEGKFAW